MIWQLPKELGKAETIKKNAQFTNIKFAKEARYNMQKLKSIDKSSLGLNNNNNVFINKNLTRVNNKVANNCRKLKSNNLISKTYTVNGEIHSISDNIRNRKPVKVLDMK